MAKKKPPPPPPSPSPKTLPPRKAIHTLTASDQPKNQTQLTAFFGIGSSAPPRPIIADEPEAPIIVISSDDDEEGRRALPNDQQQRPVAEMPSNASQRHSPRPRRQPRPRTFGDFVPSSGSGESSSDSEKRRRIFEETKKSLDRLVTPDESRPSSSSSNIQRPSTSGSGSNNIQRPSTSGNVTPPPYSGSEWDTDGDATLKQRKKVAAKKMPAPLIRTSESRISFLGHEMTKQSTKFLCPYVDQQKRKCKRDFTTYSALQKHFQSDHKLQKTALLKPVDTAPNNWRRIQNDNKRFRLSTVKLKLCSLLVGGKAVVAANRQRVLDERKVQQPPSASSPTQLQKQQNEMAQEVFEIIQKQAAELSKLTILFSHLVYFKIYRLINTNDERVTDMAFQQNINWNLILLTFKQFLRATKNATIPNAKTTQSDNNTSLYTICATDFFDLCHEFDVGTSFEQWSQNAWNYIADTFQTNFRNNIMVHLYQRTMGQNFQICAKNRLLINKKS